MWPHGIDLYLRTLALGLFMTQAKHRGGACNANIAAFTPRSQAKSVLRFRKR